MKAQATVTGCYRMARHQQAAGMLTRQRVGELVGRHVGEKHVVRVEAGLQ